MTRTGYETQNGNALNESGKPGRKKTRKCEDCPMEILSKGGKLRCPDCAISKRLRDNRVRAKAKRRAHKETA